jgi:hypothetical protein
MKLHLFYEIIKGLEPRLYGFTTNKQRAQFFQTMRKGFYYKIVNATKEQVDELYDNSGGLEITLQSFKTSVEGFPSRVVMPATCGEVSQIALRKEEFAMRELQRYAILPMEIFTEEVQEALRVLSYDKIQRFYEEVEPIKELVPDRNVYELDFEVDELGIFILLHKNTINDDYIKSIVREDDDDDEEDEDDDE